MNREEQRHTAIIQKDVFRFQVPRKEGRQRVTHVISCLFKVENEKHKNPGEIQYLFCEDENMLRVKYMCHPEQTCFY